MAPRSILPTLCLRAKPGVYVNKFRTVSQDVLKTQPDEEKADVEDKVFKPIAYLEPLLMAWTSDSRAACVDVHNGLNVISRAGAFAAVPLPVPCHLSKIDVSKIRNLCWDPTGSMLVVGWAVDMKSEQSVGPLTQKLTTQRFFTFLRNRLRSSVVPSTHGKSGPRSGRYISGHLMVAMRSSTKPTK